MNIVRGSIISVLSGFLAALIAGENRRSPLILVVLLVAFGLLIVAMSWIYVPLWYHIIFTSLLIPMPIVGGKSMKFADEHLERLEKHPTIRDE